MEVIYSSSDQNSDFRGNKMADENRRETSAAGKNM